ncbi:MAG: DUF1295 domain-containing protein [Thermoplasmatota archaeon]
MGSPIWTVYVILLSTQLVLSGVVLLFLFFVSAPYGKHNRKGWGPRIGSRWAWISMELPAVFVIPAVYIMFTDRIMPVPLVLLFLWETHYLYRTFLYPSFFRGSKNNFPIILVLFAFLFNVMNGFINGYFIAYSSWESSWLFSGFFITGAAMYIMGFILHVTSDARIRALRRPDESGYRIPRGGAFRFVSNPNYLGEMVQWFGWAVITFSLPGLAFALFTTANLLPRAISNHRWYRRTFDDYPKDRRIIFPYIF